MKTLNYEEVKDLKSIIEARINSCQDHINKLSEIKEENPMISLNGVKNMIRGYQEQREIAYKLLAKFEEANSVSISEI